VELVLGEVHPRFGLRFAACGLPAGEGPAVLVVEADDHPDSSLDVRAW
jgi:hypothetical protein